MTFLFFANSAWKQVNLVSQYVLLTSKAIADKTKDMIGVGRNIATRKTQNNMQAQTCLMNTLTPKSHLLVVVASF